jgi:PadR family transcriptional regulator PadR
MAEQLEEELTRRLAKAFLDIQLLRIIEKEPAWGYKIKKTLDERLRIKLRHGALYPTLAKLQKQGYLESQRIQERGRARKTYMLTEKGKVLLQSYRNVLLKQVGNEDSA